MDIKGKYSNDNFVLLNVLGADESEINSVKIHEIIHMLLALQTKWGCVEYYFNHIGRLIDHKYIHIAKKINKSCEYVQESLAEFWVQLYQYREKSIEEFKNVIREYKFSQQSTYKYLEYFLDIANNNKELTIEEIAFCLYRIALHSMNIEITDIDLDAWECEDIQYGISHDIPNNVFRDSITRLTKALEKGDLNDFLNSLENEWSRADTNCRQQQLNIILEYIRKICINSNNYKEIDDYLSTIQCKEIDLNHITEYIIPTTFTQYNLQTSDNICDINSTILFIFGDGQDFWHTIENKPYKNKLKMYFASIGNRIGISYMCYSTKTMNFDIVSLSRLGKIMKRNNYLRVISYKAFENNPKLVDYLERQRARYYVYCDRPYWSAKQTIESLCIDKAWMVIDFKKFCVICLKVQKYGILFVPVCCEEQFYHDLNNYYKGKKITARDMFNQKGDMNKFNLVINCLFGT